MKLREFVDKLKNFKPGEEITDMPAHNKVDPTKCAICGKKFKEGEKGVVSDVSGTQFHQDCFDKAAGNDVLKQRRTDNQLPYDESKKETIKKKVLIKDAKLKPGMKTPPKGYKFAYSIKVGDTVKIWANVPKGLKLGQTGKVTSRDGSYIVVMFSKNHNAEFYPSELIMKV